MNFRIIISITFSFLIAFASLVVPVAYAQILLEEQSCFQIINQEDRTVYGHVETAYTQEQTRHRSNFRLDEGEQVQVCTTGPLYSGGRLKFVVRTLFPVFECLTRADRDVIIRREQNPDGSYKKNDDGFTVWAQCY